MRRFRSLLLALLAFAVGLNPAAWSAAETVPPEIAAKRAGADKAARAVAPTLSPLNLIFTPIAPCRVFGGVAQSAGQTLNFQITGTADLTGQGGPGGGCGVPAYAKAVSMNLSATSSAAGKIIGFAKGTPRPNTVSLNYQPGKTETAGTIVAMDDAGKASIYTSAASRTFGDVTGYYEPQLWAYVGLDGNLIDSSGRILRTLRIANGTYDVIFDRDVFRCSAVASSDYEPLMMAAFTGGARVTVYIKNGDNVFTNYYFNLIVNC
jgi:hypothetical protein